MSISAESKEELSQLKRALLALKEMRARLDAAETRRREPIAIIGMACRFPGGADSPEAFWQLLQDGVDAITEVPPDRWDAGTLYEADPAPPGKINTRWGGFLTGVDHFDAAFFGISPREAVYMDPQQRLLLEVAWEALETAGQTTADLAGSQTGVFVGAHSHSSDYYWMQVDDPGQIDTYTGTGTSHSVLSGRLSYLLDLRGPSLTIDTACSSSLVAVHLACQSLRQRECDLALAGGVNLILSPTFTMAATQMHMLAPDGRCKAFDARADGFVRGEGCGVILLKRLSAALADGDNILAVIRGSAVNQDGYSNGLTAPNGLSQQNVIRQALAAAGVEPGQITYVETHGTGTSLGDPIEVEALATVFDQTHPAGHTCALGSAKTNIGHLEGAAGIAGLIKAALSLQHEAVPPLLHLTELNPHISLAGTPFAIPTDLQSWPVGDNPRYAGVSSFGWSGTNAHVILEEPPRPAATQKADEAAGRLYLLPLSARSPEALRSLAAAYREFLLNESAALNDICYSASLRRSHHDHRLALLGQSPAEMVARLDAFLHNEVNPDLVTGRQRPASQQGLVFVFAGQGAQLAGMARELLATEPVFRAKIQACDELLYQVAGWSLLEELAAGDRLENNDVAQPAIFALQVALADLWRAWGIVPEAVVGHSVGEVAAAHVAGVLSLEDAIRIVFHRGRLTNKAAGWGKMAAVGLSAAEAEAWLASYEGQLAVAVVNSPASTVLSGDAAALEALVASLQEQGVFARLLAVNYPSHSPYMEELSQELVELVADLTPQPATIPIYSSVTGQIGRADEFDAAYWGRNLCQPVNFAGAIRALGAEGYATFVEIGRHASLAVPIGQCLEPSDRITVLASMRRNQPESVVLLRALANLYSLGYPVNWPAFFPAGGRFIPLPTYPWQRRGYWLESKKQGDNASDHRSPTQATAGRPPKQLPVAHPLLGWRLRSPLPTFENELSLAALPFLGQHRIYGAAVLPTTAFVEMILAAAKTALDWNAPVLADLSIQAALILPDEGPATVVQLILSPTGPAEATFEIVSLDGDDEASWTRHATGKVLQAKESVTTDPSSISELQSRCPEVDVASHYQRLTAKGVAFGADFQGIIQLWSRDSEALGRIQLPEATVAEADRYHVHPALLDACLQPLAATWPGEANYLLISWERLWLADGRLPQQLWSHIQLRSDEEAPPETLIGDVYLYDDDQRLLAEVRGIVLKRADEAALRRAVSGKDLLQEWLYDVQWQPQPICEESRLSAYLPTPGAIAERLLPQVAHLSVAHDAATYQALAPQLDALSAAYVLQAFHQLGWQPQPGQPVSVESLAGQLGVVDHYHHLLTRMLSMLAEEGILKPAGDGWLVISVPEEVSDTAATRPTLVEQHPAGTAELTLIGRCGPALAGVLRGETDPLPLLFSAGSFDTVEKLYQSSPFTALPNALMGEAVATARAHLPPHRPLRVLEIGAGTGATTSHVLPHLPAAQTEYVFTDVSPLFLERAQEKFRDYPFVRYALLDVERDPAGQGFELHTFDVVLAANVLHATADLRQTLQQVQQLLAPEGLLLLLEVTQPQRWIDLTFGLTDGWWKFADDEWRPSHPLLSTQQWLHLLQAAGFSEAAAVPDAHNQVPQSVILARQVPMEVAPAEPPGNWLILADKGGVGEVLAEALQARGQTAVICLAPEQAEQADGPAYFEQLLDEIVTAERPLRGVVYLWALDIPSIGQTTADALIEAQRASVGHALHLVQALVAAHSADERLWLVTRQAQAVATSDAPLALSQSPLWGLGRVIALEHPEKWGGLVDLDGDDVATQAANLLAEIWQAGEAGEDQVAWRGGDRYVARLLPAATLSLPLASWRNDGAYLITGGLGGLGLQVARWLAERGVRHLVLVSRSGLPERANWARLAPDSEAARRVAGIRAIEVLGATVTAVSADVGDEMQMAQVIGRFGDTLPPLRGVIHGAAAITFVPLAEMSVDTVLDMFRAKVTGAWVLHRLTREIDLDCFILFSSTTALWGANGMAHYAAANCFLDALAHYRHDLGLPALSLNWGLWQERRILSDHEQTTLARFGLKTMPATQALEAMSRLLAADTIQKTVAVVDWAVLKSAYEAKRKRPFLSQIQVQQEGVAERPTAGQQSLLQALEAVSPIERHDCLLDYIRGQVAGVMRYDASYHLDPAQGLFDLGMDSLMAVELKNRLETAIERSLSPTLIFNYPSIEALAGYLEREVLHLTPTAEQPNSQPVSDVETAVTELESISEDDLLDLFDDELAAVDDLVGEG